jgi:serine phosphatase RsbU (regulator of sigma subunit)
MMNSEIDSPAFQLARLHSERTRVVTLLRVFGSLLILVVIRGGMSLAQGYRGEAWPFALLLAVMILYEVLWLRFIRRAIHSSLKIPDATWIGNIFIESLLPTIAILLQIYTPIAGPQRALTSPAVLTYFLFIILSTLHLNPNVSRLAGAFSAAGYATVCTYVILTFPHVLTDERILIYGTSLAYAALLLVGGFTAAAVAGQIRTHVIAALREAESLAKIAQLEHDLDLARSIQQGLLPTSAPTIDGFDIAGWNKPADETGGDYFDWQELVDGRLAITVADVTGHGIGSALCMAACRAYARAAFATEQDLRNFLCRMNQLMHADLPTEKFVTMVAGLLEPVESTLHLISAGHGPLIFYSSDENSFRAYHAQGVPLGLLPRASYSGPQELKFNRGDILVLVTDGFLEWANSHDEEFGEVRLKEVIRANHGVSSAEIISALHSAVLTFAGPMPQLDDLTALVVKRV